VFEQVVQLTTLDDNTIRHFMRQTVTSEKVKAGLEKALSLREALQKTQREIAELQRQLDTIRTDQPRLRSNLKELPQTSEAYQRIVKKFNEQESEIEKYQADIKKLQGVEHEQRKAFDDYLAAFTAE
jgi:septal ring factor EnvC (AmiA/AmiB activator)